MKSADWLAEVVMYGGVPMTRAAVIADLQRIAPSQAHVDRYMDAMPNWTTCARHHTAGRTRKAASK